MARDFIPDDEFVPDQLTEPTADERAQSGFKKLLTPERPNAPGDDSIHPSFDLMDVVPVDQAALAAGKLALGAKALMAGKVGLGGLAVGGLKSVGGKAAAETAAIDLNEAARLARAKNMGFDTSKTYYHGTPHGDIPAFDPHASQRDTTGQIAGFFTENPTFAGLYTTHEDKKQAALENILPVHLSVKRTFDPENETHLKQLGESFKRHFDNFDDQARKQLAKQGIHNGEQWAAPKIDRIRFDTKDGKKPSNWMSLEDPVIIKNIQRAGFDSMHVLERGTKNTAVFDPANIRSKFAAFDPSQSASGSLSAGLAGAGMGLGALGTPDDAQASTPAPQHFAGGGSVRDFIPDSEFVPDQAAPAMGSAPLGAPTLPGAPAPVPNTHAPTQLAAAAPAFIPDSQFVSDEEKYGTPGQMALTAAEGLARGAVGPVATAAEAALTKMGVPGLSPEAQARREEVNPWLHGGTEVLGLAAPALVTGGASAYARAGLEVPEALRLGAAAAKYSQSGIMSALGEGAVKSAGLAAEKNVAQGLARRAAAGALREAVETATFQTGDEIAKRINDPNLGVGDAVAHIGLSGLIGAGAGGAFGAVTPFWKAESEKAVAQGIQEFKNAADGSVIDQVAEAPVQTIEKAGLMDRISRQKPNTAAIVDAASRNGWPLAEGMTSYSKEIQMAEDALLNGPPTLASIARRKVYDDAYKKVGTSVDHALAEGGAALTETEAGDAVKGALMGKLQAENAPINALYREIEGYQSAIPLEKTQAWKAGQSIRDLIDEHELAEGTPAYNFVKSNADKMSTIDNLARLKNLRTTISKTAGPENKWLAGQISERMGDIETKAIKDAARALNDSTDVMMDTAAREQMKMKLHDLVDQMDSAKTQYRQFKGKLQTLGKSLGKKNVRGPQDFIDFIDEMNPQTLAKRIFNDRNTQFASFFAKEFPEEMQIMRSYQRGALRTAATKEGAFLPKVAVREIEKLEPEMQKLLLTDGQMQTVRDAKVYMDSFPKSFNPSGTAHESAYRAFFEHPTGAAIANLRDFGIQAFIKAFGKALPGSESEAARILPTLGKAALDKDANPSAFRHALEYATSVIKGEMATGRAAKSVFKAAIPVAASQYPDQARVDHLDKKLRDLEGSTDHYAQVGGDVGHYLPAHDVALKGAAFSAVTYLNGLRPRPVKLSPLDPELEPSDADKAKYHRVLAIAERPLCVVSLLKGGQLTSDDVQHLGALYPGFKKRLSEKLTEELSAHVAKGERVPYDIRFGLSTLLGQPMDSSLSPENIQKNQAAYAQAEQQEQQKRGGSGVRPTSKSLREMKSANRLSLLNKEDSA